MPAVDKKRLAPKEQQQFRTVVRLYESKMYKKASKAVETILKKFPDHGESLAMKALIFNSTNKKTEAYEWVKKAITADITSFLCWHAYGLICRSDRNYAQAIKCYQNALKHERDNLSVMRDLAYLQIQTRDIEGYTETWRQLMMIKPEQKTNWICYAIGLHQLGRHETAVAVLDEFLRLDSMDRGDQAYESSELLLYRNTILEDGGELNEALADLTKIDEKVLDKYSLKERRAHLFNRLSRFDEAKKGWEELLDLNPDNHKYHKGYQTAHGLSEDSSSWTEEQRSTFDKVYTLLKEKYPRCDAVGFFNLQHLTGDRFHQVLDEYARKKIQRGVPSLFEDLRSVYDDPKKREISRELFQGYVSNLEKSHKFSEKDEKEADPDAIIWVKYFLAQHFDETGDYNEAHKLCTEVIAHTPTLVEAYLTLASIYKHGGDPVKAVEAANTAREMDLADRYLNNECARYQLAADQVEEAIKTVGMFSKEGEEPLGYLEDMQAMWFETCVGKSFLRQNKLGRAIKSLLPVHKHFDDIVDDQLDFHSYCLRKMTLRSYVSMLKLEDRLQAHAFYHKGVKPLVRAYIQLHDNPTKTKEQIEQEKVAAMPDAERKKYNQKQRAAEKKRLEEQEKLKELNKGKPEKKVDEDPDGEKLEQVADKLKEAEKYLTVLKKHSPKNIQVQLLTFEVAFRQKKPLLALQALTAASKIDRQHPALHSAIVRFFHAESQASDRHELVKEFVSIGKNNLVGDISLEQFTRQYLDSHRDNYASVVAAAQNLALLDASKQGEATQLMSDLSRARGKTDRKAVLSACEWMRSRDETAEKKLREEGRRVFPFEVKFQSVEDKQ